MTHSSIVIAARNQEGFLATTIDSALAQTRPTEVVVVNDGSDDGTRDVIDSYGSDVVALHCPWSGQGASINAGIAAATGRLLFLLDGDDLADPNRVESVEERFAQRPDATWARHSLRAIDGDGRVVVDDLYRFGSDPGGIVDDVVRAGKTPGTTSGLVFRPEFFHRLGPIPEHYTTYPDSYLLLRGGLAGGALDVQTALGSHRWHQASFTAYGWRQWDRAPFHIGLRCNLATDAQAVAVAVGGPQVVAEGRTWWQLKAMADARKGRIATATPPAVVPYRIALRALLASDLPAGRRLGLALRSLALAAVPARLFGPLWWVTHVGRASIVRTDARSRLA